MHVGSLETLSWFLEGVPNGPLRVCNSESVQMEPNGPIRVHLVPFVHSQSYRHIRVHLVPNLLGTTWNPFKDHWWSPDHWLRTTDLLDAELVDNIFWGKLPRCKLIGMWNYIHVIDKIGLQRLGYKGFRKIHFPLLSCFSRSW